MKIILSADPFVNKFDLAEFETGRQLDDLKDKLPEELKNKLIKWYDRYLTYVFMLDEKELEKYKNNIDELDKEGIELLREISKFYFPEEVDKFYYYGLCSNLIYIIDREKEYKANKFE